MRRCLSGGPGSVRAAIEVRKKKGGEKEDRYIFDHDSLESIPVAVILNPYPPHENVPVPFSRITSVTKIEYSQIKEAQKQFDQGNINK